MVFNVDDNKCFFSTKSAYYNDTEGSCDTEDWSNDAEKCLCHHRNKNFKCIKTENKYFSIVIFYNISLLLYIYF